ncbi:MAG: Lpg1974 family pore-forming outer membrane protein [Pirellulales bacterium]
MTRTWLAILATIAALVGVNVAVAQAPPGSFLQTTPTGQSFLMVPNGGVQPAAYHGGPETQKDSCDTGCDDCFIGWQHCYYAYGGAMYLRARDSEVAYAVGVNNIGLPAGGVQVTPVAVVDHDFQPGFFVGFGMTLDECSSIGVNYMQFESSTNSAIAINPAIQQPYVINSLVVHPGTLNVNETGLNAAAQYDIRFNIADIEYRGLINGDCYSKFNYLVGVRIAQAEQQFTSSYSTLNNNNHVVTTDIDFYGAGLKFGLEYERIGRRGFMVYGRTNVSFVPGEFQADYDQVSVNAGPLVDTGWKAGRLVTMADVEIGAGWTNACGTLRLTAGYNIQAWFNTVQTDEWIRGVQTNNFVDMSSMQSFDGLMARLEARF